MQRNILRFQIKPVLSNLRIDFTKKQRDSEALVENSRGNALKISFLRKFVSNENFNCVLRVVKHFFNIRQGNLHATSSVFVYYRLGCDFFSIA
jgi:hypothetical protein